MDIEKIKDKILINYWLKTINRMLAGGVKLDDLYAALGLHLHLLLIEDVYRYLPKSMKP